MQEEQAALVGSGAAPDGTDENSDSASQDRKIAEVNRQAAEANRKTAEANRKTAEAELAREKLRAKNDRRSKRGDIARRIFRLPGRIKALVIGALIAVVLIVGVMGTFVYAQFSKATVVSESSLMKVVSISKLSTTEFTYRGVAQKTESDNPNKVVYRVYYQASVKAGADMEDIRFDIDNSRKVVRPLLPDITIENPVLNDHDFDVMPRSANPSIKEEIALCKADAKRKVVANGEIRQVAENNLREMVEGLLLPIVEANDYTIEWSDANQAGSEGASADEESK